LEHDLTRQVLREFLLILAAASVMLLVAGSVHYYAESRAERFTRESTEKLNVVLAGNAIDLNLDDVVSDLLYLAERDWNQAFQADPASTGYDALVSELKQFSRHQDIYDQIRFLDDRGREVVRINYNGGQPLEVASEELQNKSERYYYAQSRALDPGQIYISSFDLNIEQGRIEQPPKPTLRFGTPVLYDHEHRKGVLLLNYLGSRLIHDFQQAAANIADHVMLLNEEGYWLSSPDPTDEWGFMYGDTQTFGLRFPEAWQRLREGDQGQFETVNGLFSFTTVYPALSAASRLSKAADGPMRLGQPSGRWKVVSFVPTGELTYGPRFLRHTPLYGFMFALLAIGSLFLAQALVRHRQAEAQVAFEQRFRQTLENVDLLALGVDADGAIAFCNDALLELTGWERQEIIHRDWFDCFVPESLRGGYRSAFNTLISGQRRMARHEEWIMTRDGTQRLVSWNNALMTNARRAVTGLTYIGDDITESRQAEEQLRKLSRAVEQSPSIVLIVDTGGHIEYVNPKFTQLTGYTLKEVRGQNPRMLKSGETSSSEYAELWRTISSGGEWRGIFHNRKKNGELYWESASISGIRDADSVITHYLAVKEDITERKRLEQEVEDSNREIARNQALAAMGRMASMIAHDLRNPLSSIKMGLQILGKRSSPDWLEQESELKSIALEQVAYMEEILEDLLSYSRPEALTPEWISVEKLLDKAVLLAQRQIETHDVTVKTSYPPGLPTVNGDARKLRQVFSNLIINAVQATEGIQDRASKVRVSIDLDLAEDGPCVRISICDNGRGIDAHQSDKLFEPFYTTRARGTGLGLAIVRRILDQHHGLVTLEPAVGHGTCAVVILPTRPVVSDRAGALESADPPGAAATESEGPAQHARTVSLDQ
jgi:PAS domain S-box-containing protein